MKPILDGKAKSFEITEEATDAYNTWLQNRLSTSVWTDCNSYYLAGGNNKTKVIATFPGPVSLFWWLMRTPRWELFRAVGADGWKKQRRAEKVMKWGVVVVIFTLALSMGVIVQGPWQRTLTVATEQLKSALSVQYLS